MELCLLPNLISLARILAAPFVYLLLSAPVLAGVPLLLLSAGIICSDFLDGALARRLGQTSRLGLILDPLGDKACLIAAIVALLVSKRITLIFFGALLFKDVAILLGAALLAGKKRIILPSNWIGKWTTVLLSSGLAILVLCEIIAGKDAVVESLLFSVLTSSARLALLAGTGLAIFSLAEYGAAALRQFGKKPSTRVLYGMAAVSVGIVLILILLETGIPSFDAAPGPWL